MPNKAPPANLSAERRQAATLVETDINPVLPNENVFETLLTLKAFNKEGENKGAAHIQGLYEEEVYYLDVAIRILMTKREDEKKTIRERETARHLQRKFGRTLDGAKKLATILKRMADEQNEKALLMPYVNAFVAKDRQRAGIKVTKGLEGMFKNQVLQKDTLFVPESDDTTGPAA